MKRKIQQSNGKHAEEDLSDAENGFSGDESELDSDSELQKAFLENRIKPGLNMEIPQPKKFANNQDALKRKYKDIYLNMDWIERLDVTVKKPAVDADDEAEGGTTALVDNDFKREHLFFQQAQTAVLEGLKKLHSLGVPTKRPEDYYAEMAKSDAHMKKVKEQLLSKEAELEKRENVRKLRQLKKIGKQVQIENMKKKQQDRKQFNNSIEDIKKGKSKDTDVLEERKKGVRRENKRENGKNGKNTDKGAANKKRKFKDSKFGFGGRKKRSKYNTKQSSSGFDDYNAKVHGNKSSSKGKGKTAKKFQNKNKPKKMMRK